MNNKPAVVSGGSTGNRLASVLRQAHDGFHVLVTGRNMKSVADGSQAIGSNSPPRKRTAQALMTCRN